jgi:hypothetical protein
MLLFIMFMELQCIDIQTSCTSNVLEPLASLWEGGCIIECANKSIASRFLFKVRIPFGIPSLNHDTSFHFACLSHAKIKKWSFFDHNINLLVHWRQLFKTTQATYF